MRWLFAILLWSLASNAQAQEVKVTTGDHPDFTRVVLESPLLSGWQLTRLPDGYALRLTRPVRFNLDQAFRVITRDRLAALAGLDDGRSLQLTVDCACHAIGFDYRPGIVVIDLRDGPPPEGSSFEMTDVGRSAPPLRRLSTDRPPARPPTGWNWVADALAQPRPGPGPGSRSGSGPLNPEAQAQPETTATLPLPEQQTLALRQTLLQELAEGAARGLVEPTTRLSADQDAPRQPTEAARVGLLALPGMVGLSAQEPRPPLTAQGGQCIAAERINLPDWGDPDLPVAGQVTGLAAFLGEFDRPDPDALTVVVRRHLWLGFGAEARALVSGYAADLPDAGIWLGLAKAVDGETDPHGPFADMSGCDSPAALWAAVSNPRLASESVNEEAVLLNFSALPPHLRQSLGPALTEKFLQAGDASTAQSLRDSMLRGDPGAGALVDARIALRSDRPDLAETEARAALAAGGPDSATALVTLIEARFQSRKPLDAADVTAISALRQEQPDDPALLRAAALAMALSGAFSDAFAEVGRAPDDVAALTAPDIWALLAETGQDADLLEQAILPDADPPPVAQVTAELLARRLTALGFGAAAKTWLGPNGNVVELAAADMAAGDARAALTRLAGRPGPEAAALRARALLALGDATTAADLLADEAEGDPAQVTSARIQARDWDFLRQNGPAVWQAAAAELGPTPQPGGPLTDGRAVLTQSGATRAAVKALLDGLGTASTQP